MSRSRASMVGMLAVFVLGAAPGPSDQASLLEAGDAAFSRGDYALAAQLYARAESRSADPGRVSLGLAAAKYRLALENPVRSSSLLAEAEALYRCCLDPDDPRRAAALVGLGNCLVREAANRDAAAAWSAAERFSEAELAPDAGELAGAARHNLQRARLLARQIPTAPPDKNDKPSSGDDSEQDRKPPDSSPQSQDPGDGRDGRKSGARAEKADAGQSPTPADDSASPGKGELPPVPDRDGLPPLTPTEAREHLEQAARRIMEEGRLHRRVTARPPAPAVRDW
jgi:tetratricopeptide (TPR) repeat protein